jgi:1-acyl-sn-glycerol-3-phosphate acyltransferase
MGTLRASAILAAFAVITLIGIPVQIFFLALSLPLARWFAWRYWWWVCRLVGLRVRVQGKPLAGACLIAANHASWLDIIALGSLRPLCFVAKREVGGWPLLGWIARLGRTVFVDRERRGDAQRASHEMARRLAAGDSLVLFPEGTSSDGNRVLPFRSTLLAAAGLHVDGALVPVQPVTIAYTRLAGLPMDRSSRPFLAWYGDMRLGPHLWQALKLGPVDIDIVFHSATDMSVTGDRKALARYCEDKVRSGLVRAMAGRLALLPDGSP